MGDPAPGFRHQDNGTPTPAPPDDPRLHWHRVNRRDIWQVHCAVCGEHLTVGLDLNDALRLAARNATARPCCAAWSTTTNANPTTTPTNAGPA